MQIFLTFLAYSFIGWIWESIYCSFKARRYVYRGFLLGPYCPVYGFGVTAVLLIVPDSTNNLISLFFNSIVVVTIIEFLTSWLLEKCFSMKLWDYSKMPFNIEGRVAVPVSLFWGMGCVLLIKIINPIIQKFIFEFNLDTHNIVVLFVSVLFSIDVLSTVIFTLTTKQEVEGMLDNTDKENAAIKEFRLKNLLINHPSSLNRDKVLKAIHSNPMMLKHLSLSRILKNYPNLKLAKHNKKSNM